MDKETVFAGIIGGVVADALGVPYEFSSRYDMKKNPAEGMTGYGRYFQPVGTWSDDSSMTLALMDSLINGIDYEEFQGICSGEGLMAGVLKLPPQWGATGLGKETRILGDFGARIYLFKKIEQ